MRIPTKNTKAFTLIEIMVAVLILAVLSTFIINLISQSGAKSQADLIKIKVFSSTIKAKLAGYLMGDWGFSEGTGTTVYDASDYKNNATLSGTSWVTDGSCVTDNCLSFDGSSSYITLPSNPLTLTQDFTISFWVNKTTKQPTTANNDRFVDLTNDSNNGLNIITDDSTQKYGVLLKRAGTATINQLTYGSFVLNSWVNIVYVVSGSTGSFYLNGVNIPSDGSAAIALAGTGAYFGKRADGNNTTFFKGKMDEVAFYNATMSLSQIKQQYRVGLQRLLTKGEINLQEYNQRIADLNKSMANN
jgi:prepilin-type N-terminal cleavage/methylation domain-containing protein